MAPEWRTEQKVILSARLRREPPVIAAGYEKVPDKVSCREGEMNRSGNTGNTRLLKIRCLGRRFCFYPS